MLAALHLAFIATRKMLEVIKVQRVKELVLHHCIDIKSEKFSVKNQLFPSMLVYQALQK